MLALAFCNKFGFPDVSFSFLLESVFSEVSDSVSALGLSLNFGSAYEVLIYLESSNACMYSLVETGTETWVLLMILTVAPNGLYDDAIIKLLRMFEVWFINIGDANIRYGTKYEMVNHLPPLSVIG